MKIKKLTRPLIAAAASLTLGVTLLPTTFAQAAENTPDGSSSDKAAASCYEIKQNNPDSKSGAYWLFTPEMEAPAQFYCDQETDGGGWVMLGRGREGWTEDYQGKGNPADLANNPDGTDAFSPVQLDSKTVDALMGGQSPSDLEDGLLFRRATNAEGTQWQNAYAKRMNQQNWTWALAAFAQWSDIRFDNPPGLGLDTNYATSKGSVGNWDNRYNALVFKANRDTNWLNGFTFGYYVRGSNTPTTHLWSKTGNTAMAFTQLYARPKLTQDNAGFETIADTGLGAEQQRALPSSFSSRMEWRTSLETGTGNVGEMNTQVQAITQVGDTVFTGGDFKNLVSRSGETVDQRFLAGFNVKDGQLVRSFMPKFNGQIKALEGLSNGKLAVGGEFTQVNGEDVTGFVVLDPVTGEIDRTFDWKVENRLASDVARVRTIQEANGYLYIGGAFTHVKGNTSSAFEYSRNAARFNMSNGSVDWNWNPEFNGTVNGISAGDDNENVYAAGYFSTNRGERAWKLANMNTTTGYNKMPWDWKLSYYSAAQGDRAGFQFDVQDAGSTVWAGGAEHLIAQYNKSDLSRSYSAITKNGGDFQDLFRDKKNGIIYGSCHCENWAYEGADTHDNPEATTYEINRIRMVGAWDETTGKFLQDFNPMLTGQRGNGIWESFVDSEGVLWVGGDISKTLGTSGTQDTVGFARYAPRDITPAAAPSNLQVATADGKDQLSWTSGTKGATDYQVLRNDRVIATVTGGKTTYEVDHQDGARYFVRSVDNAGNYSETTPVATAPAAPEETPAPVDEPTQEPTEEATQPAEEATPAPVAEEEKDQSGEIIAAGSQWDYLVNAFTAPADWKNTDTTVTGWQQGKAPLGWGTAPVETVIPGEGTTQPASIYVRKSVTIDKPENYSKLVIKVRSDDGSVLYVNGKEVNRDNMAAAPRPIYAASLAMSIKSDEDAQNNWITVEVPASDLQAGKNTIALSVHAQDRWGVGASASFDLSADLQK